MKTPSQHRIPSLDGLRALSIGLVLLGHGAGTGGFFSQSTLSPLGDTANLGVRVFFVISGFLITTLLLDEMERTGTISLRMFYFRRTMRIFPAAYVLIGCVWAASATGWTHVTSPDVWHAFSYTMNYSPDRSWDLGHLWSLSLEEQFYLTWPAALWLAGRKRGFWTVLAVCAVCPVVRIVIWLFFPAGRPYIGNAFFTEADSVATGCLLAIARGRLEANFTYRRIAGSRWLIILPVLILPVNRIQADHPRIGFLVGETILNFLIALVVHAAILAAQSPAGRILNSRPLVYLGTLSYSIYLWQQIFMNRAGAALLNSFPFNMAAVFLAGAVSYHLVESPCLRFRSQLEKYWRNKNTTVAAAVR